MKGRRDGGNFIGGSSGSIVIGNGILTIGDGGTDVIGGSGSVILIDGNDSFFLTNVSGGSVMRIPCGYGGVVCMGRG